MIGVAYNRYRLYITKAVGLNNFVIINELELYESANANTVNLSRGAVATSSSLSSAGYQAKNAIDGKAETFWNSSGSSSTEWITVTLPSPILLRSFRITSTIVEAQIPMDFILQGSNNNIDWTNIYEAVGNTADTIFRKLSFYVSGVSNLDIGVNSSRVIISEWTTGKLIEKVVPKSDGSWSCQTGGDTEVLVTHIGPSGYEPKSDGPITPYSW